MKREMYDQMLEDGYNPKLVFMIVHQLECGQIDGLKVIDVGDRHVLAVFNLRVR